MTIITKTKFAGRKAKRENPTAIVIVESKNGKSRCIVRNSGALYPIK